MSKKASGIVASLNALPKASKGQHLDRKLEPAQLKDLEKASARWKAMPRNDRPTRKDVMALLAKHGIHMSIGVAAKWFPHDADG